MGGKFWFGVYYDDVTIQDFSDTATSGAWRKMSVLGSQLTPSKYIEKIAVGAALDSVNAGKTFYADLINGALL